MVISVIQKVKEHWRATGVPIVEGATAAVIEKTEAYFDIRFSHELSDFYSSVNGLNDEDDNGFAFYPLERWENYNEIFRGDPLGFFDQNKVCIIFIDYLQASWYYALLFERKTDKYTIGILPHGESFVPITDSLNDFLRLYLEDDPILYTY
ncbi:SMI1/KNR4 family protein [Chitinophaga flava]|uniref:Knr4/Smi1-like domain-containing protein n=1 Tax=Chitinophaga flava TaxID=2259036 RepID=A0A365Y2P3_9BACT|nr:SMI1/KNR4 family protein [Chitinophaga flava]RBL92760.1 hypothetical protein DF182_09335 [Chitinophaga flava]